MYFATSLTSTLLLAGGALAQYGSGSGSSYGSGSGGSGSMDSGSGSSSMMPSSSMGSASAPMSTGTPSGPVRVHVVKVSNKKGDLIFEPNNMQAAPGEMVQFHFYPKVSVQSAEASHFEKTSKADFTSHTEPQRCPIYLRSTMPTYQEQYAIRYRLFLRFYACQGQRVYDAFIYNHGERHETYLVLLQPGRPLPGWDGWCHQSVSTSTK